MTQEVTKALAAMSSELWGVWFLIGAALVFWMQAGFAMVEAGFTRAKNTGNIIMKNLMDFCIGTVVFIVIGFSFLLGEDLLGFIGKPGFDLFTNYANFDWSNFIFNLVFCATTATIVSGAMAERTKFLSYCVYSAVISALVYPIEAHWIWGGGWLAQMGFHDFAGSCAIHMVGGIAAWIKYGKPDVSMCLNASLAGLVAITASCDVTDALGAICIGAVAGVLVVFGVWLLDYKLHIDDPVGAVAVHCLNGIWGTIAVGLFATPSAPGYSLADGAGNVVSGLFYGGGFKLLGWQLTGFAAVAAWAAITMLIVFYVIKAVFGLRVTEEEEVLGLDSTEHGLKSAYAGFVTSVEGISGIMGKKGKGMEYAPASSVSVPMDEAVPVQVKTESAGIASDVKLSKVDIICRQSKFEDLKEALNAIGVQGITVTQVLGCGTQKGKAEYYRGVPVEFTLLPKMKVEVVVSAVPVSKVVAAAKDALYTGHIGDGKIFIYDVGDVIKVRTGESGFDALQDD